MANTNKPFGLKPVGYLNGSAWDGKMTEYSVLAANGTAIFKNDAVVVTGAVDTDEFATPVIAVATAGARLRGVMAGINLYPADMNLNYRKASTYQKVLVIDDPNVVFRVQGDASATDALLVGLNANIVATAGSTTTGQSAFVLNTTGATHTSTLQCKVLRRSAIPGNVDGAYAVYDVVLNHHDFKAGQTGYGA